MTWFKVDDGFHHHPKVLRIPRRDRLSTIGLWTVAGAWSAGNLTDGLVPSYMLEELGGRPADAARLVTVGLWDAPAEGEDGWRFHDWADWQPTRQDVQLKRQANAEKVRNWRKRNQDTNQVGNPVTPESQDGTLPMSDPAPDPTRPDQEKPSVSPRPRKRGTRLPEGWEPPEDVVRQMRDECPTVNLRAEHLKFSDYWHDKTGNAATKLDWVGTWRNWIRTAAERGSSPIRPTNGHTTPGGFDPAAALARARAAQESAS